MKVANYGSQGQVQSFRGGSRPNGESKPAEAQDQVSLGGPGGPSQQPSGLKRAGKAVAVGAAAGLAVGLARAVSPYLGALAGAVPAGLAGISLAIVAGGALLGGRKSSDGGVGRLVGSVMTGAAAGLAAGVALPFMASPEMTGAAIGAATLATQWLFSSRQ